jgi:hypothetical protein
MKENLEPRPERTDEQIMDEIKILTENEGWRFHGSIFQGGEEQEYKLILSKEGAEDKVFLTKKPYPGMVDASGKLTTETN